MATTMRPQNETQKVLESHAGTLLFMGAAMVVLGVIAIFGPGIVTVSSVILLGSVLIAAGIVEFIQSFRVAREEHKGRVLFNVMSAIVYLLAGATMLWRPVAGALSLTLLISAYLIVSGVINIAHGSRHRKEKEWGWFIFGGLLDVILGALIAAGWPSTGLWVIGLFIGVELLTYGSAWIATSIGIRHKAKELQQRAA